jgi:hypothetical protein
MGGGIPRSTACLTTNNGAPYALLPTFRNSTCKYFSNKAHGRWTGLSWPRPRCQSSVACIGELRVARCTPHALVHSVCIRGEFSAAPWLCRCPPERNSPRLSEPPMSPLVNQIRPKIILVTMWSVGGRWRWHPILNTPTLFALLLHKLAREKLKIQDGK